MTIEIGRWRREVSERAESGSEMNYIYNNCYYTYVFIYSGESTNSKLTQIK